MPQVDLETLVSVCSGGGDRKIGCETQADNDAEQPPEASAAAAEVPDLPPESFWLSKDAEYDWFDRNAFYERKESTKGNSNSTNLNPASNSSSQRISKNLKSRLSIFGLPKTQKTNYIDKTKRKPTNIRLFPKRSESVRKSAVTEPSSPKVSCMGRVRSKRGCRKPSKSVPKRAENKRNNDRRRTGLCQWFVDLFRFNRKSKPVHKNDEHPPVVESPPRKSVTVKSRNSEPELAGEPPGLGGMMRFASGRRSGASLGDVAESYLAVGESGPARRG